MDMKQEMSSENKKQSVSQTLHRLELVKVFGQLPIYNAN